MVHGLAGYQVATAGIQLGRHVQTNGRWSPHLPINRLSDTGGGIGEGLVADACLVAMSAAIEVRWSIRHARIRFLNSRNNGHT